MALNGSIVITTRVDTGQASASLEDLIGRIESLENAQRDAADAADEQAEKTNKLEKAAHAVGIAVGLFSAAVSAAAVASFKLAADLEQSRVAFTTLLGSGEKARKFLDELAAFAASTPFEFKDLQDSSRRLLAFGFAAKDIIPIMNAVGSAVAGLGGGKEQIDRVTLALGQMQAKGKVSAEEMNQIAELGIPGWQMIASAIGKSIPEAMKLAEKGAIDSTTAINALITGMNEKFPGMLEKQSQTINGQLSNLRDGVTLTATLIGEKLISAFHIADVVGNAARAVSGFAQVVKTGGLKEALEAAFPPGLRAIIIGIAGAVTVTLLPALGAAVAAATPFLAIGAGIAAAAYLIIKNWTPVSAFFGDMFGKIGRMAERLRDTILRALGKPIVELGTISRTSMRLSQAGASIKPTPLEEAAGKPIDFFAGFKDMFSDFVPDLQKLMNTTVSTVANTTFTGLSGKTPVGSTDTSKIAKEQKKRIDEAKQVLENALKKADLGKAFDYDAAEKALMSYADVLKQNGATASEIEEINIRILELHKQQAIESQKSADIFNGEAKKAQREAEQALKERERIEKESQQRTAAGLREAYGVALNLLRGDFEGVATFFRGKLEESLVNALSKSPAVQNAIAQLGSAFTGPLGIAALFGSLLVSAVISAGEQSKKVLNDVKATAEQADRLLNPEKYKNENPAFAPLQALVTEAEKNLKTAQDAQFQAGHLAAATLGLVSQPYKDATRAVNEAQETLDKLRERMKSTPQFLAPGTPGYQAADVVYVGGRPVMRSDLPTAAQSLGIKPASEQTAQTKPAAMPGETPDKPIYTQVVNVRDFRDAFPDSAYFRAPSVDTTRSLNANAVAYR